MPDPFKPTFGVTPPVLVGRSDQIATFADALEDGPGSTGRATLYTGARGSGKTVMLNAVEEEARSRGWLVVSETATENLVATMTKSSLPALLQELDPATTKLTGITLPVVGGGITLDTVQAHMVELDLRRQITLLTDLLAVNQTGLLITVDEVHRDQAGQLRELATVIQHGFREERELAFVAAGLPLAVKDLLNDSILTFLRRADRQDLGAVDLGDVQEAILTPIEGAGREVEADALEWMVQSTGGYPFMIQLVGSQCWRVNPENPTITLPDAEEGTKNAQRRLGSLVHAPALTGLSDIDKSFLLKMAEDDGRSRMRTIAERLGVDRKYASVYRDRLISAQLIESAGYGYVNFALPYLREYLREHAASLVLERD